MCYNGIKLSARAQKVRYLKMKKFNIYLDMDGTIANLYNVPNWLEKLKNEDTTPYEQAESLVDMELLSELLKSLLVSANILSWTSKGGSIKYNRKVRYSKLRWLQSHGLDMHIIDKYIIVPYGTNKAEAIGTRLNSSFYLFDDELNNRLNWMNAGGTAYGAEKIIEKIRFLLDLYK